MKRLTHKIVNDNEHKRMKFAEYPEFKLKIEFLDGHTEIYIHCINYYLNDISGIYHITYWDGWKYVYIQINRELVKKISTTQNQIAIEELEFVLKNFRNRPAYFNVARQELCLSDQDKQFIDFINNRIKELKGENK